MLMRVYIPFALMFSLNMVIISRLQKSKRNIGQVNQIINGNKQISNKERMFKIKTVIMDFTFLVFYMPVAVNLTLNIVNLNDTITKDVYLDAILNNLFANLSTLLAYSYSVALIFIFLIFNKYFRDELLILLRLSRFINQVEI